MAVTELDPKTALLVIDLQKGIAGYPLAHPLKTVVNNTNRLAAAFRERGLPVVLVVVKGGAPGRTEMPRRGAPNFPPDFADLLPDLHCEPDDLLVTKYTPGAFTRTDLDERLRALGVTQVAIVGVATSGGVESTARQAYEFGFNVTLAVDAMSDVSLQNHTDSITGIFPRLGETGATDDILELLAKQSS